MEKRRLLKYTWDTEKRESNLLKHGLDFVLAEQIINAPEMLDLIDDRYDYGEERHIAYAVVNGERLCLCYTLREDEIRVISLRHAHEKEWRRQHGT